MMPTPPCSWPFTKQKLSGSKRGSRGPAVLPWLGLATGVPPRRCSLSLPGTGESGQICSEKVFFPVTNEGLKIRVP